MMTTALRRTGQRRFDDRDEDFNSEAAHEAYEAVMKCATDDEARVVADMILGEVFSHGLVVHQGEIAKAYTDDAQARLIVLGHDLAAAAVLNQREGRDNTAVYKAIGELEEIAKAMPFGAAMGAGYDSDWHAEHARKQKRDLLSGRFVQEHREVVHLPSEKAVHPRDANLIGIPDPTMKLTARQNAVYQRGYREVQDLVGRWDRLKPDEGVLHINYATGQPTVMPFSSLTIGTQPAAPGKYRVPIKLTDAGPNEKLDPKRKITSASVSSLPPDSLTHAGVSRYAGRSFTAADGKLPVGMGDTWDPSKEGSLGDELTRLSSEQEGFTPTARTLRRLAAVSNSLSDSLPETGFARTKLALDVGQKVGEVGPQAQKVIGPAADRAAYRYRGTERARPDQRLLNALNSLRADPTLRPGDKRERMIHGSVDDQDNWRPGGVLSYFRTLLPRADLNTLQRKSGTIPPSQGVIFDKRGRPAVQAVGFGDDHYLPFNLRNLSKLKGGEYIRTRTFGGPTTEDIYTGLVGRARAMTVVSHNGAYTVEFDEDLKGGRRFNDKAARMVARYGQLLDAVKSEQVTTGGLHPSALREIQDRAATYNDPDSDPEGYEAEVARLKRAALRRPQFSQAQRQEATAEFFTELAAKRTTPDGHVMSAPEMIDDWASGRAAAEMQRHVREHGGAAATFSDYKAHELAAINSDDPIEAGRKIADAMNVRRQLDAHLERSEDEYRKSLTPLRLDSQGYELALTALQEQFPYYIKRVSFEPWVEGGGGFDTGYVAPRHNRPGAVLAGYFDEKILGHGKVRADSTRYQNYAVRQGKLTPATSAMRPTGGRRPGSTATEVSGPPDPEVAAQLKASAARALIAEVKAKQTFSPHAISTDPDHQIANTPIDAWLDALKDSPSGRNLHYIMATPADELEAELRDRPEQVYAKLHGFLRENEQGQYVDVTPGVRRSFINNGRIDKPVNVGDNAAKHLNDSPDTEYDFPESIYHDDTRHAADDIQRGYENDPRIKPLIDSGALPKALADGQAFEGASKTLRTRLAADASRLLQWKSRRASGMASGPVPVQEIVLQRQSEGLLRAQQLRRRHAEALQREVVVTPAVETEVHIIDHRPGEDDEPGGITRWSG